MISSVKESYKASSATDRTWSLRQMIVTNKQQLTKKSEKNRRDIGSYEATNGLPRIVQGTVSKGSFAVRIALIRTMYYQPQIAQAIINYKK